MRKVLKLLLTHDRTFARDFLGKTVAHMACEADSAAALQLVQSLRPDCVHDLDKANNHKKRRKKKPKKNQIEPKRKKRFFPSQTR